MIFCLQALNSVTQHTKIMKPLINVPEIPSFEACITYLEVRRWNSRPECPYCHSNRATKFNKEYRYHCNGCNTSYSVTVNTIFHHSHVPIQKWFCAIAIVLTADFHISSRQLASLLDINKNTANEMIARMRDKVKDFKHRDFLEDIANVVNQSNNMQIQGEDSYE